MSLAADGLLDTIKWLHPEYAPLIDFVKSHEDTIIALAPVVTEAIKEGPGALAAADKAAPDLAKAIRTFVATIPGTNVPQVADYHSENIVRKLVRAPAVSDDEHATWWVNNTGA
jgi:hypothetical protein